jgi:hypothetical protein
VGVSICRLTDPVSTRLGTSRRVNGIAWTGGVGRCGGGFVDVDASGALGVGMCARKKSGRWRRWLFKVQSEPGLVQAWTLASSAEQKNHISRDIFSPHHNHYMRPSAHFLGLDEKPRASSIHRVLICMDLISMNLLAIAYGISKIDGRFIEGFHAKAPISTEERT